MKKPNIWLILFIAMLIITGTYIYYAFLNPSEPLKENLKQQEQLKDGLKAKQTDLSNVLNVSDTLSRNSVKNADKSIKRLKPPIVITDTTMQEKINYIKNYRYEN